MGIIRVHYHLHIPHLCIFNQGLSPIPMFAVPLASDHLASKLKMYKILESRLLVFNWFWRTKMFSTTKLLDHCILFSVDFLRCSKIFLRVGRRSFAQSSSLKPNWSPSGFKADARSFSFTFNLSQHETRPNPVADGWTGAVMQKPLGIQKCYRPTNLPTDTGRCRVACLRLKTAFLEMKRIRYKSGHLWISTIPRGSEVSEQSEQSDWAKLVSEPVDEASLMLQSKWAEWAVRVNECSERPSGSLKRGCNEKELTRC